MSESREKLLELLTKLPQFERDNPSDGERAGFPPLTDVNRRQWQKAKLTPPELPMGWARK